MVMGLGAGGVPCRFACGDYSAPATLMDGGRGDRLAVVEGPVTGRERWRDGEGMAVLERDGLAVPVVVDRVEFVEVVGPRGNRPAVAIRVRCAPPISLDLPSPSRGCTSAPGRGSS